MKPILFTRPLQEGEQPQLEAALQAPDAFPLRRAQYLLASARGQKPAEIAQTYGGCEQTVRNVIRAFNAVGLDCLTRQSQRPKTILPIFGQAQLAELQHLLHQSPRAFDKKRGVWSQALLAEVAYEQGLTEQIVSEETIRRALGRLGANWKRAKHWITSPDPAYALKKSGETV